MFSYTNRMISLPKLLISCGCWNSYNRPNGVILLSFTRDCAKLLFNFHPNAKTFFYCYLHSFQSIILKFLCLLQINRFSKQNSKYFIWNNTISMLYFSLLKMIFSQSKSKFISLLLFCFIWIRIHEYFPTLNNHCFGRSVTRRTAAGSIPLSSKHSYIPSSEVSKLTICNGRFDLSISVPFGSFHWLCTGGNPFPLQFKLNESAYST